MPARLQPRISADPNPITIRYRKVSPSSPAKDPRQQLAINPNPTEREGEGGKELAPIMGAGCVVFPPQMESDDVDTQILLVSV